jgi:hypothetical protein
MSFGLRLNFESKVNCQQRKFSVLYGADVRLAGSRTGSAFIVETNFGNGYASLQGRTGRGQMDVEVVQIFFLRESGLGREPGVVALFVDERRGTPEASNAVINVVATIDVSDGVLEQEPPGPAGLST